MRQTVPAGWYPDPENPTQKRYWDGGAWTQNLAPTVASTPAAEAPSPQAQPARPVQAAHSIRQLREASETEDSGAAGCLFVVPFVIANKLVPLVVMAAIASALFNVGIPLLPRALQASVLFSFVHALLVMPLSISIEVRQRIRMIRQRLLELGDGDDMEKAAYELSIPGSRGYGAWRVAWLVISAIAAFLLHDPLMSALSNPWADVLTIATLGVGFQLGGVVIGKMLLRWTYKSILGRRFG